MLRQYWPSVAIPSSVLSSFAPLYFVYTRYISRCCSWVGWVITIVTFRRRSYLVQMFKNFDLHPMLGSPQYWGFPKTSNFTK